MDMIIRREQYLKAIEKAITKIPIVILIGCRQVGKTTLLKTYRTNKNILFLNGQDTEVAELFMKFSTIENYLVMKLGNQLDACLQIDEFQFIHGISTMLKLLTDKYPKLKIICTGSSSLDILKNVNESLSGRLRVIEVFSLSFEEYLQFNIPDLHQQYLKYSEHTEDIIIDKKIHIKLNEYLTFGGFPRISFENEEKEKIELLDDIFKTYLLRDVRNFIKNEDFIGFNKLIRLLAAQIGNLVNFNELSRSSGLTYRKCEEYVSLLEQMYIIKMIEPLENNKRNAIKKMKKIYFSDLGLRNIIYGSFHSIETRTDKGALFENYILLELLRNIGKSAYINFFRTTDGTEVDFIINTLKEIIAVEVKYKTFEKPLMLKSLSTFIKNNKVDRAYIFNKNYNQVFNNINYIQAYFPGKITF